jgi:hypothetical protein
MVGRRRFGRAVDLVDWRTQAGSEALDREALHRQAFNRKTLNGVAREDQSSRRQPRIDRAQAGSEAFDREAQHERCKIRRRQTGTKIPGPQAQRRCP